MLARLLPCLVSLFTFLGGLNAHFSNRLGDDGFQDILDESPNHICIRHNLWLFEIVSEKESRLPASGLGASAKIYAKSGNMKTFFLRFLWL